MFSRKAAVSNYRRVVVKSLNTNNISFTSAVYLPVRQKQSYISIPLNTTTAPISHNICYDPSAVSHPGCTRGHLQSVAWKFKAWEDMWHFDSGPAWQR